MDQVTIDGSHLTLDELLRVSRRRAQTVIAKEALARTDEGRKALEELMKKQNVIYGVNTGFGALANFRVPDEDLKRLQTNLVRSHATSVGKPLPSDVVRAMMILRANTLLKGNSGIRPEVVTTIVQLLNKEVHPYIPEKGSVGASGDLSPLSHMALVLIGEGRAEVGGKWLPGRDAMKTSGSAVLTLEAKEGLALNNGTQQMVAMGSLCLQDAYDLLECEEAALALSLEALNGWVDAFDERIHRLRPHPGQQSIAEHVRLLLKDSKMVRSTTGNNSATGHPQDPYSFRCAPQVMGAARDALEFAKRVFEVEMNSATDNPLLFPSEGLSLSGGNFHGQPVAMAIDFMSLAISILANISERRTSALLDQSLNNGLPPFLVGGESKPGLASGMMAVQYTATALVAECKLLTHPASSDSIPTSSNFEDFVSMGPGAAHKARNILENAEYVVAIELLVAAQGVYLRGQEKLGEGTNKIYDRIRRRVKPLEEDRSSHEDIEQLCRMIRDKEFANISRPQKKG
ncbi:MAG TPA: histidine ammonia-lyase [Candidatus Dormibacteraeota bacterium]|nr:histidine ammonia-lyase [Candidatus Dormibacteraeota bacterium]